MRANASSVLDAGAGPVEIHGPTGTVLLNTAHSAYVFRVDRTAGTVRHVHWGLSIPLADAVALPLWSENDNSFAGPLDGTEEYPFEGGARFAAPAFEVRFGDGSSPVEPTVQDPILLEGNHVVVPVQDRCRPLAWRLHYRVPAGGDVVQRWVDFVHTGTEDDGDILLVRGASAHWPVPQRPHWRMSTVYGSWSAESRLHRSTLPIGETTLGSRRGHTGHHANPWIAVDPGDTGEEHGEVWLVALATSGSWRITAQRTAAGRTGILASEGHEAAELLLRPGQQHRTPVSLAQYTTGGFGTASRSIHRHLRTHVLPHPSELRPVLYNSWEATSFEVNEDNQIALARRAAALGVELFVLDDGWFRGRDDDRSGLGDWTPHPRKFPRGLRPLADEVHRLGMKFGLWVEPEMVNVNSDLYRAHPEWLLHIPDRTSTELRHQLVLDFSRQEVTDWALQRLCRLVRENHVDFLKWDFNRSFTEAAAHTGGPDARRVHREHARGLYSLLDHLRAEFPQIRIESCAGGGGRVDPGILSRADQVWTSDNTDALDRLTIQHGFSQLYPANVMSAWVTDSPNPLTGRTVPMRFRFHSAMAGVLGIGGNLSRWTEAELTEATDLIRVYKDIRPVVQQGRQFRLLTPGEGPLSAVQYVHAGQVAVLIWQPAKLFGLEQPPLRLRGLEADALYRDEETGQQWHGRTLMNFGLPLPELPSGDYASALVHLREAVSPGPDA